MIGTAECNSGYACTNDAGDEECDSDSYGELTTSTHNDRHSGNSNEVSVEKLLTGMKDHFASFF